MDLYDTVSLTPTTPRRDPQPRYTTNDGRIEIVKTGETWTVGPVGARPFVTDLGSLEAAVDFVLGARAMMRPA
jgi:hypothetical protein